MDSYKYDPPELIKGIFDKFIWESETNKILFTFDDGPNKTTTPLILDELEKQNIKAVFFCVGENIINQKSLAREITQCGHLIANHTMYHNKLTRMKRNQIPDAILRMNAIAEEFLNLRLKYFRPPYGRFTFGLNKILDSVGMKNVMWSLLTYDYKNDINIVKFALDNYLKSNSIMVFHDSDKSKGIIVDSIRYAIENINRKGYSIGTPAECLK